MTEDKERTTDFLTSVLKNARASDAERYLNEYSDRLVPESGAFTEYVRGLFRNHGVRQQDVFLLADIPERYGYKLVSGEKTTQRRDVILRIFFAAGFSLDEVQHALKLYGMPELYPRFPRDAVLIIAVNSGLTDPYDVDDLLNAHGMPPLTVCGSD